MFNKKTKIRIKNFQPLLRVKHSGLFRLNAKIKIDIFTLDKVITRNNSPHHKLTNGDLRVISNLKRYSLKNIILKPRKTK